MCGGGGRIPRQGPAGGRGAAWGGNTAQACAGVCEEERGAGMRSRVRRGMRCRRVRPRRAGILGLDGEPRNLPPPPAALSGFHPASSRRSKPLTRTGVR